MNNYTREKVLFIVNPKSGKMLIKKKLFDVIKIFSDQGFEPTILMTTKCGDATKFAQEYGPKFDRVISCGGDGTLNEVAAGIMSLPEACRPPLGFIPAGTTNDLAKTLGIPTDPEAAAKSIIENKAIPNDVGLFNHSRYFSYVASCGAFTAASYSTPQGLKNTFGHAAYIFEGIKELPAIKSIYMKIETPEFKTEGKFLFAAITNALSMGGVFKIAPQFVNLQDGEFEIMLVRSPKNPMQTFDMLHHLTHLKYDDDQVIFFHAPSITITTEEPVQWTVDGEFGGKLDKVDIKNLYNAIKIFRPDPKTFREVESTATVTEESVK